MLSAITPLFPIPVSRTRTTFQQNAIQPMSSSDLISACSQILEAPVLRSLLARGFLLSQALEQWSARGIWLISRADRSLYPDILKKRLCEKAPALLYKVAVPYILQVCTTPKTREVVACELKVPKGLLSEWLSRCLEEGLIRKQTRQVGYVRADLHA